MAELIKFPEDEEPEVRTGISPECSAETAKGALASGKTPKASLCSAFTSATAFQKVSYRRSCGNTHRAIRLMRSATLS